MNGQTKYDYPPQPSQATGDFLLYTHATCHAESSCYRSQMN